MPIPILKNGKSMEIIMNISHLKNELYLLFNVNSHFTFIAVFDFKAHFLFGF